MNQRPDDGPLGRGWTPPVPPDVPVDETADDPETTGGGLGDLFGDTSEPAAESPFATRGEPGRMVAEEDAGGLGGLFGDVGTESPEPPQQTAPQPTSQPTRPARDATTTTDREGDDRGTGIAAPRIRRRPLPQQIFTVDPAAGDTQGRGTVTPPTGRPHVASATTPEDRRPVSEPTVPSDGAEVRSGSGPAVPQPTSPQPATPGEVTDGRSGPRAASVQADPQAERNVRNTPAAEPRRPSPRDEQENERLWNLVDQTLAVIGTDPALQRIAANLELTRDLDVHRRQRDELTSALRPRMANAGVAISGADDIDKIIDRVLDELTGISVLGDLWRDNEVDEIMVDRWDVISVERRGRLERTGRRFRNAQHAESTARVLALKVSDRAVSRSIPLVTAELPSARVSFAFGAVVKGGLSVTIRKFKKLLGLDELLGYGSLDQEMVEFLRDAVRARASILVSGGTGTGKTTIVNLLSTFIPDEERVITIEDAFELKLANTHVVSLQTKEASSLDDTVSVTLADLLRNTLRMRPDRIVVGEIREGEGAMVMLAAASTGHDGTITTIHANSPESAMNERLPDLVRQERAGRDDGAILRSVASAFDLVVQVTRGRGGKRYISRISAVIGVADDRIAMDPVFVGTDEGGAVTFTRWPLRLDTDLARRMIEQGVTRWTES